MLTGTTEQEFLITLGKLKQNDPSLHGASFWGRQEIVPCGSYSDSRLVLA
jgi:hypothetical protein